MPAQPRAPAPQQPHTHAVALLDLAALHPQKLHLPRVENALTTLLAHTPHATKFVYHLTDSRLAHTRPAFPLPRLTGAATFSTLRTSVEAELHKSVRPRAAPPSQPPLTALASIADSLADELCTPSADSFFSNDSTAGSTVALLILARSPSTPEELAAFAPFLSTAASHPHAPPNLLSRARRATVVWLDLAPHSAPAPPFLNWLTDQRVRHLPLASLTPDRHILPASLAAAAALSPPLPPREARSGMPTAVLLSDRTGAADMQLYFRARLMGLSDGPTGGSGKRQYAMLVRGFRRGSLDQAVRRGGMTLLPGALAMRPEPDGDHAKAWAGSFAGLMMLLTKKKWNVAADLVELGSRNDSVRVHSVLITAMTAGLAFMRRVSESTSTTLPSWAECANKDALKSVEKARKVGSLTARQYTTRLSEALSPVSSSSSGPDEERKARQRRESCSAVARSLEFFGDTAAHDKFLISKETGQQITDQSLLKTDNINAPGSLKNTPRRALARDLKRCESGDSQDSQESNAQRLVAALMFGSSDGSHDANPALGLDAVPCETNADAGPSNEETSRPLAVPERPTGLSLGPHAAPAKRDKPQTEDRTPIFGLDQQRPGMRRSHRVSDGVSGHGPRTSYMSIRTKTNETKGLPTESQARTEMDFRLDLGNARKELRFSPEMVSASKKRPESSRGVIQTLEPEVLDLDGGDTPRVAPDGEEEQHSGITSGRSTPRKPTKVVLKIRLGEVAPENRSAIKQAIGQSTSQEASAHTDGPEETKPAMAIIPPKKCTPELGPEGTKPARAIIPPKKCTPEFERLETTVGNMHEIREKCRNVSSDESTALVKQFMGQLSVVVDFFLLACRSDAGLLKHAISRAYNVDSVIIAVQDSNNKMRESTAEGCKTWSSDFWREVMTAYEQVFWNLASAFCFSQKARQGKKTTKFVKKASSILSAMRIIGQFSDANATGTHTLERMFKKMFSNVLPGFVESEEPQDWIKMLCSDFDMQLGGKLDDEEERNENAPPNQTDNATDVKARRAETESSRKRRRARESESGARKAKRTAPRSIKEAAALSKSKQLPRTVNARNHLSTSGSALLTKSLQLALSAPKASKRKSTREDRRPKKRARAPEIIPAAGGAGAASPGGAGGQADHAFSLAMRKQLDDADEAMFQPLAPADSDEEDSEREEEDEGEVIPPAAASRRMDIGFLTSFGDVMSHAPAQSGAGSEAGRASEDVVVVDEDDEDDDEEVPATPPAGGGVPSGGGVVIASTPTPRKPVVRRIEDVQLHRPRPSPVIVARKQTEEVLPPAPTRPSRCRAHARRSVGGVASLRVRRRIPETPEHVDTRRESDEEQASQGLMSLMNSS